MDRKALGTALREARENRGISQQAAAKQVGLSRTVIAQIELGNRDVSDEELSNLAAAYGRPTSAFALAAEPAKEDVLSDLLRVAPWLSDRRAKLQVEGVLDLCRTATHLETTLGRGVFRPPHYELPSPRNLVEAIAQGEHVAAQERQRLGLGPELPIQDVASLLMSQGIRTASVDFPEEVLGIFVREPSVGSIALINTQDSSAARRLAFLGGYAHALFERGRTTTVTTPLNVDELIQRRASAFAVSFLLPAAGVLAAVSALGKGQPSRKAHTVFSRELEKPTKAESRSAPGSQTLACHDVATIARTFGTSYRSMTYRLAALDVISDAESKTLRTPSRQRAAKDFAQLFAPQLRESRPRPSRSERDFDELKAHVAHLAVEAFRRRLIDAAELGSLASKLSVARLSEAKLLEFAEAAR